MKQNFYNSAIEHCNRVVEAVDEAHVVMDGVVLQLAQVQATLALVDAVNELCETFREWKELGR